MMIDGYLYMRGDIIATTTTTVTILLRTMIMILLVNRLELDALSSHVGGGFCNER